MLCDRILDKCSIKGKADSVSESESAARGNEATTGERVEKMFFYSECFLSCVAILMSWTLNLCIYME